MFKNLVDFSYKRNWKEAIGFYIAWVVVILLGAGLAGGIAGIFLPSLIKTNAFSVGYTIGNIIGFLACVSFASLISKEKQILKDYSIILLIILTGIVAILLGGIAGMIIPAYLTTRESKAPQP